MAAQDANKLFPGTPHTAEFFEGAPFISGQFRREAGYAIVKPPFFLRDTNLKDMFDTGAQAEGVADSDAFIRHSIAEGTTVELQLVSESLGHEELMQLMYGGLSQIVQGLNELKTAVKQSNYGRIREQFE